MIEVYQDIAKECARLTNTLVYYNLSEPTTFWWIMADDAKQATCAVDIDEKGIKVMEYHCGTTIRLEDPTAIKQLVKFIETCLSHHGCAGCKFTNQEGL